MNEQTIEKIKETLAPLAEKIGEGAEFTYMTIYKQVIAEASVTLGILAVFAVLFVIGTAKWHRYAMKKHREAEKRDSDSRFDISMYDGDYAFWAVFGPACVWVVYIVTVFTTGARAVLTLLNPHYYAIERLLEIVQNGGQM